MDNTEIKLRIVEALTRTDGSMARSNPAAFIESVDKIATYVAKEQQNAKRGRPAKVASTEADKADFMS